MDWGEWNKSMHFAEMTDGQGNLGRPLFPGHLLVPAHVAIEDGHLVWSTALGGDADLRFVRVEAGLLGRFVRLADGDAAAVLQFARRYGPLRVSRYEYAPLEGANQFAWRGTEPVQEWYALARNAATLLRIAALRHQGRRVPPEDWRVAFTTGLLPISAASAFREFEHAPSSAWHSLQHAGLPFLVNMWLTAERPSVWLTWPPGAAPTIVLAGDNLLSHLAAQLLAAVCQSEGVAVCSGCGTPYMPDRRPRGDQRHYCKECGIRAAWRDSKRRGRQRKKQAAASS